MDIDREKKMCRRNLLARLQQADPDLLAREADLLREMLGDILRPLPPMNVCLYASHAPYEPDLLPLLTECPRHAYYFPRCGENRDMLFHRVTSPSRQLLPGRFGIREPDPLLPTLSPHDAHLIVVPGIAFTPEGCRLGHGGGYYDRFLPQCDRARILSVAFAAQMVSALPCGVHDVRIPQIILVHPDAL